MNELGSEPVLRDDEAVCEVTNLTYLAALGRSPHIDDKGKPIFGTMGYVAS